MNANQTLLAIGERLRTQDNLCTESPMFCVQEKKTIYGMDPRWADDAVWIDTEDGAIEIPAPEDGMETSSIVRTGKLEYWQTVMVAFTAAGCEEYLRLNGHNHRGETRIYGESFRRCPEMLAIRKALMEPTKSGELDRLRIALESYQELTRNLGKALGSAGDLIDEMDSVSWGEDSDWQKSSYDCYREDILQALEYTAKFKADLIQEEAKS